MKKSLAVILSIIFVASLSTIIFAADLVIEHDLGTLTISETPRTIVVFDYGILDSLDVLGVPIAGVPAASLPESLSKFAGKEYADVGTLFEPDFEEIYALKPDLIIISGRQAEQYPELNRIAPTLHLGIDNKNYWGSMQSNLRVLGKIFDQEEQIEAIITDLQAKLTAVAEKAEASDLKTLILMANDGALSVYGAASRFGLIHQTLGFTPVDAQIDDATHGQNISYEYLVRTNPDVIFVLDRAAVAGGSVTAEQVLNNQLVKMTKAAQNDRIIYLDPHAWYVISGGVRAMEVMLADVEHLFR